MTSEPMQQREKQQCGLTKQEIEQWQEFWEGLDLLLGHFSNENEPLWPRTISTALTKGGQKTVHDKSTVISYYEGALRQDCKINAYPKYDELVEESLLPITHKPKVSLLFLDLDLKPDQKQKLEELNATLNDTLKNIHEHLNGAEPTILFTGGGYHVYLPLDVDHIPIYEELDDFQRFDNPSEKFMRYAEKKLSNGRSDKNHNPSFKSCMLRIPNSVNTKYSGERAKVKLIQRWNGVRARPTNKFMIDDFHAHLVQEVIDEKLKELRMQKKQRQFNSMQTTQLRTIAWIEKLIQTPIADYRKHAVNLIIIPYLVVCRGMTDRNEINDVVMHWADKCAELRRLDPSRREFSVRVRSRIDEVMKDRIPPMTLDTLKEKSGELYETLRVRGGE